MGGKRRAESATGEREMKKRDQKTNKMEGAVVDNMKQVQPFNCVF